MQRIWIMMIILLAEVVLSEQFQVVSWNEQHRFPIYVRLADDSLPRHSRRHFRSLLENDQQ